MLTDLPNHNACAASSVVGVGRLRALLTAIFVFEAFCQRWPVCVVGGSRPLVQVNFNAVVMLLGTFGGFVGLRTEELSCPQGQKNYWLLKLSRNFVILFLISRFRWD